MGDKEQNPFDYEDRVIAAMRDVRAWLDGSASEVGALRGAVALMHTELMRLRNKPQPFYEVEAPNPGLVYADPVGRFECMPADSGWLEYARGSDWFSLLELRVMRAHLLTALDNVNKALREKGSVTQ